MSLFGLVDYSDSEGEGSGTDVLPAPPSAFRVREAPKLPNPEQKEKKKKKKKKKKKRKREGEGPPPKKKRKLILPSANAIFSVIPAGALTKETADDEPMELTTEKTRSYNETYAPESMNQAYGAKFAGKKVMTFGVDSEPFLSTSTRQDHRIKAAQVRAGNAPSTSFLPRQLPKPKSTSRFGGFLPPQLRKANISTEDKSKYTTKRNLRATGVG